MEPLIDEPVEKTRPQNLKALSFTSCHMKLKGEVISFQIKSISVQDLFFEQIRFEKCTATFYCKNGKVGTKQ